MSHGAGVPSASPFQVLWCQAGGGEQHGYAPLATLVYRSDSYSPWLASIIFRRILSCSRRFLSTSRFARRKRMMPEGNPMALQNSRWAGDGESWRGAKGPLPPWGSTDTPLGPSVPCQAPRSSGTCGCRAFPAAPATHQATPTGFIGFLPFLRVGMYSTPSGSPPLPGSGPARGPAG